MKPSERYAVLHTRLTSLNVSARSLNSELSRAFSVRDVTISDLKTARAEVEIAEKRISRMKSEYAVVSISQFADAQSHLKDLVYRLEASNDRYEQAVKRVGNVKEDLTDVENEIKAIHAELATYGEIREFKR